MSRITLRALLIPLLIAVSNPLWAGQTPPDPVKAGGAKPDSSAAAPPATTSSGVMQLKRQITGDFSYRFVSSADKTGAATTAPVPLPAATGTENIVALAIPSTVNQKDGVLEILDNGRGNIARLPIATKGVANLAESSFTLAQRVNVPVQSKGLGVVGAQVTMTSASKKFTQTRLLQPDDSGVARFDAVPLNEPVTVSVSYGSNPPESQTKTLTATRPPEAWPPIAVTWPDAKTVAAPVTATTTPSLPGREADTGRRASDEDTRPARQPDTNPLNSLVSTVISLLFLAAVGYAVFWAYKTGRMKVLLDRLGINTEPIAAGTTGMPDPFSKQNRTPIQPITEGTADPFAGAVLAGGPAAPPISDGPRLIATAGAYAGNIFPLNSASADIGRDAGNPVALPNDTNASRRHATIQVTGGQYLLVDNGSSNGTFVNGVRIASQTPQPIRPGDEVQIGMTRFRFEA